MHKGRKGAGGRGMNQVGLPVGEGLCRGTGRGGLVKRERGNEFGGEDQVGRG